MLFRTIAQFEKVSFEQFYKDFYDSFNVKDFVEHEDGSIETVELEPIIRQIYENIKLPKRATTGSAGYDFFSPIELNIKPNTTVKIPTGIRCKMKKNYVLQIYPRSSLGFKYRCQLNNTVGIVDEDYFYSDNEGHIFIKMTNSTLDDKTINLKQGDAFAQGIFTKYYLAKEEKITAKRNGGFGSTNEK